MPADLGGKDGAAPTQEHEDPRLAKVLALYSERKVATVPGVRDRQKYAAAVKRRLLDDFDVVRLLTDRPSARPETIVDLLEKGEGGRSPLELVRESPGGPRGVSATSTRQLITRQVSDIKPKSMTYLWAGRIPRGTLSGIVGDPGVGKSTIVLDLVARVSTGRAMPSGHRPASAPRLKAANCLVLSAEDGVSETIRPRLELAGADLERIRVIDGIDDTAMGERRWFSLVTDLVALEEKVSQRQVALVVVDPLMAYMQGVNTYRDQDVRAVLGPLAQMAERTGTAVVLVRHKNKNQSQSALHRAGGSIGITAAMRSELLVDRDPEDETHQRRVVASLKNNLARAPRSLAFRLASGGAKGDVAKVEWLGISRCTADDLSVGEDRMERHALREAQDFLKSELAAGPAWSKLIFDRGQDAGHSAKTLKRAKDGIVVSRRTGARGAEPAKWYWALRRH
ncbi:MAG: AAA family ATPase [Acidimicrobiales bacterium]